MNMLEDVATWMASSSTGFGQIGPGTSTAYPIYKTRMPGSTGNMYVIYQYGGLMPVAVSDGTIDNPRLQVKTVSSATSDNGYGAALTAQNRLRFVTNRPLPTSTGNYYERIFPLQAPESLGADEHGRMHWVQNFQVTVSYT